MSSKMPKSLATSKPIRMWIDGKCFNIKCLKDLKKTSNKHSKVAVNDQTSVIDISDLPKETKVEGFIPTTSFVKNEEGQFHATFELPKFYYQKLQSQTNINLAELSEKTSTNIIIPKLDQGGKLKIIGTNLENVKTAVDEIHSVIGFIRDKNNALQFATIPLLSKEIKANFEKFKKEILEDEEIENIDESLFIKKDKLHLTINIFVLHDEREIEEAIRALKDYNSDILSPLLKTTGPLKIHVSGVHCMDSNSKKTNVVYANAKIVDETKEANLQIITNGLSNYFYERGLLKRPQENVKIHMTLLNSKFRKISGSRRKKLKRQSIDASKIIQKYGNYEFGYCDFNNIRIAHIFATPDKDGFYKTISVVNLNENISKSEDLTIGTSVENTSAETEIPRIDSHTEKQNGLIKTEQKTTVSSGISHCPKDDSDMEID